jgi:dTDP-4-dehydrorhamnose reductase
VLHAYGEEVAAYARKDLDITDRVLVRATMRMVEPSIVVNCAAYTAVDDAEANESAALEINAHGPAILGEECARTGARLIQISTDYVFAGNADTPYDEKTRPAPRSAYGRTKAAGEQAVLTSGADAHVVRTAWLYGQVGTNFVRTIASLAQTRETVNVVDDQIGAPTWTLHLARALVALGIADVPSGIWHCTNAGEASWYIFARAIFAELGLDPARVLPTTSAEFLRPAPRPSYSVLSMDKWQRAGLPELPHWRDALHEAFETLGDELYT